MRRVWDITTCVLLIIAVVGFLPSSNFRLGKHVLSEWCLFALTALLFVRNGWLKLFLLYGIFRIAVNYNKLAFLEYNLIFLTIVAYQVLCNWLDKDRIKYLLNAICIMALLNVLWSVLQFFGIWIFICPLAEYRTDIEVNRLFHDLVVLSRPFHGGFITGLMSNVNMTASLFALSLPAFFRAKWRVFIPLILLGLWLTMCFGGFLTAFVPVSMLIWLKLKKRRLPAILLVFGLLGVYVWKMENFWWLIKGCERFPVWQTIWERMVLVRPWIGAGLGQFKVIFPLIHKTIDTPYNAARFVQAHNDYLQLLAEQGIIGFTIMIGYVINVLWRGLKAKDWMIQIVFMGVCAGLINAGGNFLMHTTTGLILVMYLAMLERGNEICLPLPKSS